MDFGCGVGHYTIPAAQAVGPAGHVYALDKDGRVLQQLGAKAQDLGLSNIEALQTAGELRINYPDEAFDVILAYDVLHYPERREPLFTEFRRVLKEEGFLSVYPKHRRGDHPLPSLGRMFLDDVIEEIGQAGFGPKRRFYERLLHDDSYNQGIVLNFSRRARSWR